MTFENLTHRYCGVLNLLGATCSRSNWHSFGGKFRVCKKVSFNYNGQRLPQNPTCMNVQKLHFWQRWLRRLFIKFNFNGSAGEDLVTIFSLQSYSKKILLCTLMTTDLVWSSIKYSVTKLLKKFSKLIRCIGSKFYTKLYRTVAVFLNIIFVPSREMISTTDRWKAPKLATTAHHYLVSKTVL